MFKQAYKTASEYTQPLLIMYRCFDGSVEGGLGTYIVLNSQGWIMTAAHNLQVSFAYNQHQHEITTYNSTGNIEANPQLAVVFL